jgi:Kef-type K+ transport system membrane component KefB
MDGIFSEIAIVITVAAVITIIFRIFKQPAILAYMLTGILLGPLNMFHLTGFDALGTLGQLGITLLLFMLGLELRLKDLKSIGATAVVAGTLQMLLTCLLGGALSVFLGFSFAVSVYLGIALAFSSTIVIVKLLSDKKDLNSLHGKLSVGILLVQDFFAIIALILLNNPLAINGTLLLQVGMIILKFVVLGGWMWVVSEFIFPFFLPKISKSPETLFLFSLGWVFAVTALVASPFIGFSLEIGGFLAGLALANTYENYQIAARMSALRDFFVTIFFVSLGLEMTFTHLSTYLIPAIIFVVFILLVKPLLVSWIVGVLGFRKRTSFFVGISFAQISEFSLLLLFLGKEKGVISEDIVSIMILLSMVTFIISTYFIQKWHTIYKVIGRFIVIPEHTKRHSADMSSQESYDHLKDHIILIGGHQMGQSIIHALKNTEEKVLVIDFDPDIVHKLKQQGIDVFFGDISDPEIQERAGFERAKLLISTVPDVEDNLVLLAEIQHVNKKALIVMIALENDDAHALYAGGADYVVLPHLAGGHHLAKILVDKNHLEMIEKYKKKDMEYLK